MRRCLGALCLVLALGSPLALCARESARLQQQIGQATRGGDVGDKSGPVGTWYLNANGLRLTVVVVAGIQPGTYRGSLTQDGGEAAPLDNVTWDASGRRLEFRRQIGSSWQWFRGTVVEGVFVGRFSHDVSSAHPVALTSYAGHVTGWNSNYLDHGLAPRVYEVLLNGEYRGRLRIDRSLKGSGLYIGRLKVYSTVHGGSAGEEAEYDLEISRWDGTNLRFIRWDPAWTEAYTGVARGRLISGTYVRDGAPSSHPWEGWRAEVLSYGLVRKPPEKRAAWQERTRRQLFRLMMADNPSPAARRVTVLQANLPPIKSVRLPPNRDDDPARWPQRYQLTELRFDYTLANPYGGPAIMHTSHAYLAVPTTPPPGSGRYPAALALNGHGGSAWKMMDPDHEGLWYGDGFARRGFVVLALDISHRTGGDDPAHGNGPHPPIQAPGFDSDWEEDGERTWDAMRALDYLLSLPQVDRTRVLVTGISLGGEIATMTGALDPRVSVSVPAGYSPDLGVMIYHGNHGCWRWLHADLREYVDLSDFHALTAPRPLIVETGKADFTYSDFRPPFAADKQVARRSRGAYGDEVSNFVHYLHDNAHRYRVGDANHNRLTEHGVRQPILIEPQAPRSITWQLDARTSGDQRTLFDYISSYLKL